MKDLNSEVLDELALREFEKSKIEGDTRFNIGDFPSAIEHYFKCLTYKENIYLFEQIAKCYLELNDSQSALKYWKMVLAKKPFHIKARIEVSKSKLASVVNETKQKVKVMQGDYESALAELEKNKDELSKFQYHLHRSDYLQKLEKWDQCFKENQILFNFEPGSAYGEKIILCLYKMESFKEILDIVNKNSFDLKKFETLIFLGDSYLFCKNDIDALKCYSKAFELKPDDEIINTIYDIEKNIGNDYKYLKKIICSDLFADIDQLMSNRILNRLLKDVNFNFDSSLINRIPEYITDEQMLLLVLERIKLLDKSCEVEIFFSGLDNDLPRSKKNAMQIINILEDISEQNNHSIIAILFNLEKYYSLLNDRKNIFNIFNKILKIHPRDLEYLNKVLNVLCISNKTDEAYQLILSRLKDNTLLDTNILDHGVMIKNIFSILKETNDREMSFQFATGLIELEYYRIEVILELIDYYKFWFEIDKLYILLKDVKKREIKLSSETENEIDEFLIKLRKRKMVISSCLIGLNNNYKGKSCFSSRLLCNLVRNGFCYYVCPEVFGGLPTPRIPSEIQKGNGFDVLNGSCKVLNKKGKDVTAKFVRGAEMSFDFINKFDVKSAVLKSKSPSCGLNKIHDGSFSKTMVDGSGVFAALLNSKGFKIISYTGGETENRIREYINS